MGIMISYVRPTLLKSLSFGRSALLFPSRAMSVKVGDSLPDVNLYENTPANAIDMAQLCASGKTLIFGVPGAFTPGCSLTHLPGYIRDADQYKSKGINSIVCIGVNDPFVMSAWGKQHGADGKVRMLA